MDYDEDSIFSHCIGILIKPSWCVPGQLFKDLKIPLMKDIPYEYEYIDFDFENARLVCISRHIRYKEFIIYLYHEDFPYCPPHVVNDNMILSVLDAKTNYPWIFKKKERIEHKDPILYRDYSELKGILSK